MSQYLDQAIGDLRSRLRTVEEALILLKQLDGDPADRKSNRGRKSMSADERKVVSDRMRKYWADRKGDR